MRILFLGLMTAMAVHAEAEEIGYKPATLQLHVDRSFSTIEIGTPLARLKGALTEERVGGCHESADCDWLDRNKVRHHFWGNGPAELSVVIKTIKVAEFSGRPIPALGIGMARKGPQVLAAARKYVPGIKFTCGKAPRTPLSYSCSATMHPGWISLKFDAKDQLTEIRFDGYHFT